MFKLPSKNPFDLSRYFCFFLAKAICLKKNKEPSSIVFRYYMVTAHNNDLTKINKKIPVKSREF